MLSLRHRVSFISHDNLIARMQPHVSVSYRMPTLAELLEVLVWISQRTPVLEVQAAAHRLLSVQVQHSTSQEGCPIPSGPAWLFM